MYEKALEELIKRFYRQIFPLLDKAKFVESQRRLPSGKIIDICFQGDDATYYVVELKRHRITLDTIDQISSYIDEIKSIETHKKIVGVLCAFVISERVRSLAEHRGLMCWEMDEHKLNRIANQNGIKPDKIIRQSNVRTDPRSHKPPRIHGKPLPTSELWRVELDRNLNEKFPPGTLHAGSSAKTIHDYWVLACPNAPVAHISIATELTLFILDAANGSSIGRRTHGKHDSYTTIVDVNGRTLAAIDARRLWVKLDFLLSSDAADKFKASGLVSIEGPRRLGKWVQSNVPKKMNLEKALDLLSLSFDFQFSPRRAD